MIELLLTIALVGFLVFLLVTYVPMPAPFKTVIIAVAAIFLIIWMVRILGLDVPVRSLR
jgi:hypothetical protein